MANIAARRISEDEYLTYMECTNLEYVDGRLLTKSGIELLVGEEEFAEWISKPRKSLEEYLAENLKKETS